MQDCQVCGRSFDPLAFQVVVPELGRGFDRMECAHTARATALPGSTVAAVPVVAVVEPLAATAVPATAGAAAVPVLRPAGVPLATLGLLAAGTVTAVYLWLRVLGVEPTNFPLSRGFIPPATHRETVQAHVQIVPAGTSTKVSAPAERPRPATVALLAAAGGSLSPTAARRPASHLGASGPTRHILGRGAEPHHGKGKGHAKHGKGHFKHGESDGMHSAGHGGSSATSGTHGGGKGHGKGKKR